MECVLCGSKDFNFLFEVDDCRICQCKKCDLVVTDQLGSLNYSSYYRDSDYKKFDKFFKNIFKKRFEIINKFRKSGKVLEVGSSVGLLLEIFKDNGWEVTGVELSKSAKVAKKRGIKTIKSRFENAKLPNNFYDVIIFNHTLEHMQNPFKVVKKAYKLLKRGGIIFVDVPNLASLSSRISKQYWKYLLPQEHLYHFTPQSLEDLLKKSGFRIIYKRTRSGIFDVANPFLKLYQEFKGRPAIFINTVLDIPGNVISTLLNRGTSLSMIGEKR